MIEQPRTLKPYVSPLPYELDLSGQGPVSYEPRPYRLASSAATTNAVVVKVSTAVVYGLSVMNTNAAVRFVHLYDRATVPTPGTDTPAATFPVPVNNGAIVRTFPAGLVFATGLAVAMTTDAAAGNNPVAAGDLVALLIEFK